MPERLPSAAILCALLLFGAEARAADPPPPGGNGDANAGGDDANARAAAAFEDGVRQYKASEYPAAAASFLRADGLAANDEALINAILAARKGGLHLLLSKAAERLLARSGSNPDRARLAREAITEASAH